MYKLDHTSGKPLYEQIRDNLKKLIIDGVLKPDEKILSVRELAVEMTINPNTIQKAYKELENENYIYSVRAKGYFASGAGEINSKKHIEEVKANLKEAVRELEFLGVSYEQIICEIDKIYKGRE